MPNLIMAVFWLLLAATVFGWQWRHPDGATLTISGTGISFGWLGVVLGLYNLARWWSGRLAQRRRQMEADERRRRTRPIESRQPPGVVHPEFNFIEEPPPPGESDDRQS